MYKKAAAILGLVGVGVLGRLLPHVPNATPITGITFAARRHVGRASAFAIPLCAMLASDFFLGFYDWKILASVYGAFLCIAAISLLVTKSSRPPVVIAAVVASSLLFFLITNFAVWAYSPWYAKSFEGLLYCYTLGLPFLRNMLLGDLVYTAALLGAFKVPVILLKEKSRPRMGGFNYSHFQSKRAVAALAHAPNALRSKKRSGIRSSL